MDLSASTLFAGLLVSGIGVGLFLYGKKERRAPQMLAGIALCTYPFFVSGWLLTLAIGAALVVLLWVAVRMGL